MLIVEKRWYLYTHATKFLHCSTSEVVVKDDRSFLTLRNVGKANEGIYYCEAENIAGKSVFTCNLRVNDIEKGKWPR